MRRPLAARAQASPGSRGVLYTRWTPSFTCPYCVHGLLAVGAAALLALGCQSPRWPVDGPLTSPFGVRRGGELHRGVDIVAPVGTPVHPILDGRVRFAGTILGYGQVIWIDHRDDALSLYAHLSEIFVRAGEPVSKSTVIGLSGKSGDVTGPHLHLEVWRWGREVDPVQLIGRPAR